MFLCDKCHDDCKVEHLARSRGRCEGCGATESCVDCRVHHEEAAREGVPATAESVRAALLLCFRRQARLAHVARDDRREQVVLVIQLEGMRKMAMAAGLSSHDLDIATVEAAAAALGEAR